MIKLNINLGERSYPIYITTDYNSIARCFESARLYGKIAVITDSNVDKGQGLEFMEAMKPLGDRVSKLVIEAGEKNKTLDTVKEIYKFLIDMKFDRSSALVALGGGVVGDITGFAAATYLRGINFVQVPTSLLAQADSSVGGKVGVDFEGSKNVVGAFYQPRFVYINVNSLKTLPERELRSGLAEIIKHGIIRDSDFFEFIEYNIGKIYGFNEDALQYLAKVNCSIKGSVVEQDEKENDLRAILNFGHTFGHAIETVSDFELLHGECISIGMVGAFKMAAYLEMTTGETVERVKKVLEKVGLPVSLGNLDIEKIYNQMFYDKKIKNNRLVFVLPKKIGEVIQISIDDADLIKRVLKDLK